MGFFYFFNFFKYKFRFALSGQAVSCLFLRMLNDSLVQCQNKDFGFGSCT